MQRDDVLFSLIQLELKRQTKGIELIASENYVSPQVMEASGSVLTNKYAEGLPKKRYYGGCEVVDDIEELAIARLKKLFNATWANVQPHSGAQANTAVMLGLLNPGDTILGLDLAHGGHLTHGSAVNYSGKLYNAVFYQVDKETGLIDYEQVEKIALQTKPKLIICGASSYSREWDYAKFRKIANQVDAILMADIAHPAGLIAKGLLNDPFDHCDVVTSTTHKTLRGARGGAIMLRHDKPNKLGITNMKGETKMLSEILDSAVFPGTQGGPLEHTIAAKAVAFQEALSDDYLKYIKQVKLNANVLAQGFIDMGYHVVSGGTDNHLVLIDLRSKYPDLTGKKAEKVLVSADITLNKNMVPFDSRSPFQTSGIRIGSPTVTTRGLKEKDMEKIVEYIDAILSNHSNETKVKAVKKEINQWMQQYPLFETSI